MLSNLFQYLSIVHEVEKLISVLKRDVCGGEGLLIYVWKIIARGSSLSLAPTYSLVKPYLLFTVTPVHAGIGRGVEEHVELLQILERLLEGVDGQVTAIPVCERDLSRVLVVGEPLREDTVF